MNCLYRSVVCICKLNAVQRKRKKIPKIFENKKSGRIGAEHRSISYFICAMSVVCLVKKKKNLETPSYTQTKQKRSVQQWKYLY
jgi:hypothetical protein